MRTSAAIDHFGGVPALAEALGIRRQAVYQWGDEVPPYRALQLERITSGRLKASKTKPSTPRTARRAR